MTDAETDTVRDRQAKNNMVPILQYSGINYNFKIL